MYTSSKERYLATGRIELKPLPLDVEFYGALGIAFFKFKFQRPVKNPDIRVFAIQTKIVDVRLADE